MPKRKSGEQPSSPKQAAGGVASRSSNPQAANMHRSANTSHPQKTGNSHAKPPSLPGTGAAPRPPHNAHRPPNTTKSQGPGNGPPKSQGTNGPPSNFAARVEVMSGPRASQGRSMNEGHGAAKRNRNGPPNNHPQAQKAQGHGPQPNGSSKQQAPKPPKSSQPPVGAPKPSLHSLAPPRPGNVQHVQVPRAHPASIAGNKVFKDPSPTQKQSGHVNHHVQKTQNHVPTPKKASQTHQHQSGKNAANIFPKVQVAEKHAQQTSRKGQPSAPSTKGTKQRANVNQGNVSVPQASAASQGRGQMFGALSSWFFPSVPSVDKRTQATSLLPVTLGSRKAKGASPKPQAPKSRKDNYGSSKSLPVFSATLLKKAPAHDNSLPRRDDGPRGSLLSVVKSNKSTLTHRKKVPAQSGSNRAQILSQHRKKTAALRKDFLRQRGPTLIWRANDAPGNVSAYSTLNAAPVPPPPKNELQNKVAQRTIAQKRHLFKRVSPIKVKVFKNYLKDHPNRPLVNSFVRGLVDGFWPWADTSDPGFPTTYDGSGRRSPREDSDKQKFIRQQSRDEMNLGRWSKPFGKKLLPGMHSSPIRAVPKGTPGKFRLVIDQSRGLHSLNSTIAKHQVKVKLDTIHDLGNKLLAVRKKYPKRKLCLWKSDVKSAYRQLPMHKLWQIKQAVLVDGQYHIDRANTFGNRGAGWIWDRFISLVNWIATEKKGVPDLLGYVDDNFSWEFEGKKEYYKPYKKEMPTKQVRLLRFWDELGIPHEEEKQLSGSSLRILGYDVDANKMTVKVPDEKKEKVVRLLRSHAQEGKPYTLQELQSAAGSVNSALSLYPRIRPGLRVLFDEMAKQDPGTTKLRVTKNVAHSLSGLASYLEDAPPVRIQHQKKSVRGT